MKQFIHKIASVLMAFVVLFSTMSFTIDMHYCGDTLVDTAVFSKAKTCGMESMETSTCKSPELKKKCCSEEQISFEGENELQLTFEDLNFEQQVFVSSFIYTYINLFEGLEENIIPLQDYSPPLVVKDILLLDQVYLI
ncbi:MAG: hypothetical protein QM499_10505 [Flavobacteriaceae bacterium]